MRTEQECPREHRYLFADTMISDEFIRFLKKDCLARAQRQNLKITDAFHRFIDWERSENEIALYTLYAYADFQIPKQFSCIFEMNQPGNAVFSQSQLVQCLYEGRYPYDCIDDGHKHICIFRFHEAVPEIFKQLHVANNKHSHPPKNPPMLGICNIDDFDTIKRNQERTLHLKEKYGSGWWKYDEK